MLIVLSAECSKNKIHLDMQGKIVEYSGIILLISEKLKKKKKKKRGRRNYRDTSLGLGAHEMSDGGSLSQR